MRVRPAALAAGVALGAAGLAGGAAATEPRQPASSETIVEYRESGEWDRDIDAAIEDATAALEAELAPGERPAKPAIVLDVDDTSLSSYACLKRADFDRALGGEACVQSGEMPAIPQTLAFFRRAREEGVSVFFVTGRRARQRAVTTANLRSEGYRGSWTLLLRPNQQKRKAGWKARTRRSIVRRGYTILVNVGDQRSDLSGGSAEHTVKLPNPMYTIPVA